MEIVWSETALQTYLKVIDFLFIEWSPKEINKFSEEVESLLAQIKENNYL